MRKSLVALLLAVALVAPVFAAEKNMWVGGSFGYNSSNNEQHGYTFSTTAWSIEPEFGWTIVDRWDIGLDFAYGEGQNVNSIYGFKIPISIDPWQTGISAKIITVAPFVRYYLAKVAGVDVILKGSIFYSKTEAEFPGGGDTVNVNAYGISIVPIISYSINETWSIGAALNFAELSFLSASSDGDNFTEAKTEQFGFNVNNGSLISVGFSYHF
ncbi:MAG: outer membrane beta-barrel protein [Elusimicrobia bacterium]|nr:outer membrane beta-barrel protein [Elusimicrobiota bacterium]